MRVLMVVAVIVIVCSSGFAQKGDSQTAGDPKGKIQQAKLLLKEAKKALVRQGNYDCCIEGACDRCALDHQNCHCRAAVKSGKAVCSDCYAGWQHGEGDVPGVEASQVKMGTHSHKH